MFFVFFLGLSSGLSLAKFLSDRREAKLLKIIGEQNLAIKYRVKGTAQTVKEMKEMNEKELFDFVNFKRGGK